MHRRFALLVVVAAGAAAVLAGCGSGSTSGSWDLLRPTTTTTTPLHRAASALTDDQRADLARQVMVTPQAMDATAACLTAGPGLADATCRATAEHFVADLQRLGVAADSPLAAAIAELSLARLHAELKLEALDRCFDDPPSSGCDDPLEIARTAVLDLYRVIVFDGGYVGAPNAG